MKTFEAEWRARFERFGRTHTAEHHVSGWSAEGLSRRLRRFQALLPTLGLPSRARMLELGCGAGTYVRYLSGLGHEVVGIDYAEPTLQRARETDTDGRGFYVAADGQQLPLAPRSVDAAVCIGVLQAVSRPEAIVSELSRVVRPGGVVVVEALNAFELPALVDHAVRGIARRAARVRRDSPVALGRTLRDHGFTCEARLGIYLPPRRVPALGRLFDAPAIVGLMDALGPMSLPVAHAFWLVGRKCR